MAVSWICLLLLASKGRSRVSFHFSGWSKYWVIQIVSVWVCREEVKNQRVLRVRLCLFTGISISSQNQRPEYSHPTISQFPKCPHIDGFVCTEPYCWRGGLSSSLLPLSLATISITITVSSTLSIFTWNPPPVLFNLAGWFRYSDSLTPYRVTRMCLGIVYFVLCIVMCEWLLQTDGERGQQVAGKSEIDVLLLFVIIIIITIGTNLTCQRRVHRFFPDFLKDGCSMYAFWNALSTCTRLQLVFD